MGSGSLTRGVFSKLHVRLLAASLFAWLIGLNQAQAHELRPAIAEARVADGALTLAIDLNLEALVAGVTPDHDDTDAAPEAERYDALRASEPARLQAAFREIEAEFLSNLTLEARGEPVAIRVLSLDVPPVGDLDLARESALTLGADLGSAQNFRFGWDDRYGPLILRVRDGEEVTALYLTDGAVSDPVPVTGGITRSLAQVVFDYVVIGFTHIIPKGLDHILFVVGLFLLSTSLSVLLWQVTAFTLAHTVTLGLGAMGWVSVSPSIVEPLIALSIVYVCVENILSPRLHRWRPVIIFGFGLLHGLGFAGVLGEVGLPSGAFVTALLSFNVGVELGQLSVIALCFLLVGWAGKRAWYRRAIVQPASAVIALVGAFWFLERVGVV